MLGLFFSLILLGSPLVSALPLEFSPSVIYGEDNRIEFFQISDPAFKNLAASTAAFYETQDLRLSGDQVFFDALTYQQSENLCSDQPFLEQPAAAFCSGALVGPNRVLTAGHCVKNDVACSSTWIAFDYQLVAAGQIPQALPIKDVYSCKRIIARKFYRTGADYALIELDRPVPDRTPLAINFEGGLQPGTDLSILGFPEGLPLKLTEHAVVRDLKTDFFVTNADTFAGNSGSPVINPKTLAIEGILVRGETDFERNTASDCYIEHHCSETGCRGESATLASVLATPMQWITPQPAIEEAAAFANTNDGTGNLKALIRIPVESANHHFELLLEAYSRETSRFETLQVLPLEPSPIAELIRIDNTAFSLDPAALAFGGVKARAVLLMDGAPVSADFISILATQPLVTDF